MGRVSGFTFGHVGQLEPSSARPYAGLGPKAAADAIAAIHPEAWVDIDYGPDGQARGRLHLQGRWRLAVRCTRLTDPTRPGCGRTGAPTPSSPTWRRRGGRGRLSPPTRVVELKICDHKEGAGMEHVPSGNFSADIAWLQCAVLVHNLLCQPSRNSLSADFSLRIF